MHNHAHTYLPTGTFVSLRELSALNWKGTSPH